jgi:N-acetylornithine carbamoyltransferase
MAVPHSTLLMAARLGMDVTLARPDGFELDPVVVSAAKEAATRSGGSLMETNDLEIAADGAEIIYAKAWGGAARYTNHKLEEGNRAAHTDWRITQGVMDRTRNGHFMHCLPVRRGVVVDNEVLDGTNSLHLDQAEFRLHAQKAILSWLWENGASQ